MNRSQRGGVTRVLGKLDKAIEEGNFYEAHQIYRTLFFRYTSQKKFDECMELLYAGAQKLISKDQETSAADLGLLIIDTLEKRGPDATGDNSGNVKLWTERLSSIIAQLNANVVERETLITRALKWSGDVSGNTTGDPLMHKHIAQIFWSEHNIEQAYHHFLLCNNGPLCAHVLIKISTTKGYKSETDLFIVRAVLQQLCLKESKVAEQTFNTYTTDHPQIKQSKTPFYLPLLNFLYFLFRTIESKRLDTFKTLCVMYKPSLNRDPAFEKYLTKISALYFGVTPRSNTGGLFGGMFGDIFSRLFQDFDWDDDEDDSNSRRQNHDTDNSRIRNSVADSLQHELD